MGEYRLRRQSAGRMAGTGLFDRGEIGTFLLMWYSGLEVNVMKQQFSSIFYRSPDAVKDFNDRLRKEVEEYKPVENKPEAIRAKLKILQARRASNAKGLAS